MALYHFDNTHCSVNEFRHPITHELANAGNLKLMHFTWDDQSSSDHWLHTVRITCLGTDVTPIIMNDASAKFWCPDCAQESEHPFIYGAWRDSSSRAYTALDIEAPDYVVVKFTTMDGHPINMQSLNPTFTIVFE